MNKLIYLLAFLPGAAYAQSEDHFTLTDIIDLAHTQSSVYKVAATQKALSYYNYLSYQSDLKPQISFYGNAPVYSKQYAAVIQPDGAKSYLPLQQNTNRLGIGLSQPISLTGGTFSLNSEFEQFRDFRESSTSYNSVPFFLQLNQPLFAFNDIKWKKKIEPLRLEESKRNYAEEMESISQQAIGFYFDLLDAQMEINTARFNLENDSINYDIETRRIKLGTTSEDKILQLQLQTLRSKQQLEKALYDHKIAEMKIKRFIGYKDSSRLVLQLPQTIPVLNISQEKALFYARQYRPEFIAFERKMREAQRDVAQAKAARHQVSLSMTYGLNQAGSQVNKVYSDLKSKQTVSIGFNIPIIDWGRRNVQYKTAVATQELIKFNNEIDSTAMLEEVITLISNIALLRNNITLSESADSVARERFRIASGLYRIGKLTILEINNAQAEKDMAQTNFINALRNYWDGYFQLRRLTLFDFEYQRPLYGLQ